MKSKTQSVALIFALGALMLFQVKWVLGASDDPISSPITSPKTQALTQASAGSAKPQVCESIKPASAPVLISAISNKQNEVTLTWSKAGEPVTYYLLSFGTGPGLQQYGNPNVGDKNTISYTVKNLSSGMYYFRVRAGNDCMPGAFSNEISAKANGSKLSGNAKGFSSFVVATSQSYKKTATPSATPTPIKTSSNLRIIDSVGGFGTQLLAFVGNLFSR